LRSFGLHEAWLGWLTALSSGNHLIFKKDMEKILGLA